MPTAYWADKSYTALLYMWLGNLSLQQLKFEIQYKNIYHPSNHLHWLPQVTVTTGAGTANW